MLSLISAQCTCIYIVIQSKCVFALCLMSVSNMSLKSTLYWTCFGTLSQFCASRHLLLNPLLLLKSLLMLNFDKHFCNLLFTSQLICSILYIIRWPWTRLFFDILRPCSQKYLSTHVLLNKSPGVTSGYVSVVFFFNCVSNVMLSIRCYCQTHIRIQCLVGLYQCQRSTETRRIHPTKSA